ncbi:MAG: phytanoyl-CoA dioxygenase family protein [Acidobacteriota bacterium]
MANPSSSESATSTDGGIFLPSSLWIDQDDAGERIEAKLGTGEITPEQAEGLRHFIDHGYLIFRLDLDPADLEQVTTDAVACWRDKPADLAYAYDGPARRMTHADEARERHSRYRIHDLHSHSQAARGLYLNRQIFDWINLLLGEEAVAIQSLFFEYGSQQLLHRDPVVVPVASHGHMIAAWIALEDISPDCGPLTYIPGSHRLPYFETAPGDYRFDAQRMGPELVERGMAWEADQRRRHGLEPQAFTPKQGEVLLWHASLAHGGSEVRDETLTRQSFVVHYSTRSTYDVRSIGIAEPVAGEDQWQVLETHELIEHQGCRGFQNPMLGS